LLSGFNPASTGVGIAAFSSPPSHKGTLGDVGCYVGGLSKLCHKCVMHSQQRLIWGLCLLQIPAPVWELYIHL